MLVAEIGVIGLGAMGSAIARRLLSSGHHVVGWNRTRAKAEALARDGAEVATDPADAATRSDFLITMVSDGHALRSVTEGAAGVLAGAKSELTIMEMSTVGPAAISRLRSSLPDGVDLLDAPVLGSVSEAESGDLTIFVGGLPGVVRRCKPTLSSLGSVLHVGGLGQGASAKLVANSTLFGMLGVIGEALALADRLGIDQDTAFEVLATSPVAAQAARRRRAIETNDYPKRFPLMLASKDARLVTELAAEVGVDLPIARAQRRRLRDAENGGWGERDYSSLLAWIIGQT